MNLSLPARFVAVTACCLLFAGCATDRSAVTRYGPTAFSYPEGVSMKGASASDFALVFESDGFSAQGHSAKVGDAPSTWGSSAFRMNGKNVVVRNFAPAGQPRFRIVSVDGKHNTPLGRAITDWMILQSGLRERPASHKRPARMPQPAAHLYATSLFGFDAAPARVADALRATAAAEGWTERGGEQVELDGVTIGRHVFADAEGHVVAVDTYSPRFRSTLVEVSHASPDPNGPLKVFNGLQGRLSLPTRTPAPSAATALAVRD